MLADFLAFSRNVARSAILAGEFRELLNACVHIDEPVIARYLPYRLKTSGLHLLEGFAHIVRSLDAETRALLRQDPAAALAPEIRAQADALARHFHAELGEMLAAHEAGTPANRLVAPLADIEIDADVAALLTLYLSGAPADAPAPEIAPEAVDTPAPEDTAAPEEAPSPEPAHEDAPAVEDASAPADTPAPGDTLAPEDAPAHEPAHEDAHPPAPDTATEGEAEIGAPAKKSGFFQRLFGRR